MPYEINKSDDVASSITVADGQIDNTSLSITLVGRGYDGLGSGYGEIMQEGIVAILENFSNTTPPANPTYGQLWFNPADDSMNVFETSNSWRDLNDFYDGSIYDIAINDDAQIQISKLEDAVQPAQIIVSDGSNVPTYVTMTGDVFIDSIGGTQIQSNTINTAELASGLYLNALLIDATTANIAQLNASNLDVSTTLELAITADLLVHDELNIVSPSSSVQIGSSDNVSTKYTTTTPTHLFNNNLAVGNELSSSSILTGYIQASGNMYVGSPGNGDSNLYFHDNNSAVWRNIRWNDIGNEFELMANDNNYYKIWHAGNDGSGSGLDADTLDGYNLAEANVGVTVAARDGNGDLSTRLFRSEYPTLNASPNYVMTQIAAGGTGDNYIRPTSMAQFKTSFGQANDSALLGGVAASVHESANTIVKRDSSGYINTHYINTNADITVSPASHFAIQNNTDGYIRWQTPANARTSLDVYSKSEVDGLAGGGGISYASYFANSTNISSGVNQVLSSWYTTGGANNSADAITHSGQFLQIGSLIALGYTHYRAIFTVRAQVPDAGYIITNILQGSTPTTGYDIAGAVSEKAATGGGSVTLTATAHTPITPLNLNGFQRIYCKVRNQSSTTVATLAGGVTTYGTTHLTIEAFTL